MRPPNLQRHEQSAQINSEGLFAASAYLLHQEYSWKAVIMEGG